MPTDRSKAETAEEADLLERCGFVDSTGRWVIEPHFLSARNFSEGVACVEVEVDGKKRTGYIDRRGKFVIEPKFEAGRSFHEGLAVANEKGKAGFIDRTGAWVIPPVYADSWRFSEGLAAVRVEHQTGLRRFTWGFIDANNQFVIKPIYRDVRPFYGGLAPVRKGKWGAIDRQGKFVVQPKYEVAHSRKLSCLLEVASGDSGPSTMGHPVPGAILNYSGRHVLLDPEFHERRAAFDSDNFHGMTEKEVVQRLGKADSKKVSSYREADIGFGGRGFLASKLPVARRKEEIMRLRYDDEKEVFYRYVWLIKEPDGKWHVFYDAAMDKDFEF